MARLTEELKKVRITEDLGRFTKYKWEFLRRNKEYIDSWEEILKDLETDEPTLIDAKVLVSKKYIDFLDKWNISRPLNPHKSYNEMVKKYGKRFYGSMHQKFPPLGMLSSCSVEAAAWNYVDDWPKSGIRVSDWVAEFGEIRVGINLNYSKNRLMREFKLLLDEWKERYEDAHKDFLLRRYCEKKKIDESSIDETSSEEFNKFYRRQLKQRQTKYYPKYHFENFDLYLKVWDLKEKEGRSWREIASALNLNSIQTARNHYKAACGLIERGVELYVK